MLEELKKEVIRIGRRAQEDGMCKHGAGNFSSRDSSCKQQDQEENKHDQSSYRDNFQRRIGNIIPA